MTHAKQVNQEFLDTSQYLTSSILQYEAVYGEDFVSPGGRQMAAELIGRMGLAPASRVLDVGCGLGGSAFLMAREYGLQVDGIDLSKNMLELANAKLSAYGLAEHVNLKCDDCLKLECVEYYDAVYSRDVFLHIEDKHRLFSVLKKSLRPGGQLLFTDYCCGDEPWSEDFATYVENRGYCLHTLPDYAGLIARAGFKQVDHQDITDRFIKILASDLERIADLNIDGPDQIKLEHSWSQKLRRSRAGDHRWGLFTAVKEI